MARGKNGRFRLHIESLRAQPKLFQIDPALYERVARKYPKIAKKVDATISFDGERFDEGIKDAQVLVGWKFPKEQLRERAKALKLVHATGAGVEHLLPLDWLPDGAVLTNNRGVHGPKAGEFALMAILMLHNYMPNIVAAQHKHAWDRYFSTVLAGHTLLVVGVGQMGGAAAQAAKRNGLRVLGIRRSGKKHRYVDEMGTSDDLHRFLPRADYVLVTAPLTSETRHLIGRAEFDKMKPEAGFINMGRANVVDYDALCAVLRGGKLRGALLDVFAPEPLPSNSPLWDTPRLIITPHCSSDDVERYAERTLDIVFANIERLMQGKSPRNMVRAELEY
jgi:glyoxylate/hydroxypyruvate reductase